MEFGKGVVVRWALDARVKDADFFQRRDVVIDNHALAADDGHFTDFARVQPAAADHGRALLAEAEAHGRDVLDARRDVRAAAAVHRHRLLFHDVQDDGDVVRRQIPGHVDVLLEQSQVEAARGNVADFADVALVHDLLDFADGRRIEEVVAGHQDQALLFGDGDQFLALRGGGGHRLLDEGVLAREQRGLGHRVMQPHGGGDDHGVQAGAVERVVEVGFALDFGIEIMQVLQTRLVQVAHQLELAIRQGPEIADEVWPPITAADNSYFYLLCHSSSGITRRPWMARYNCTAEFRLLIDDRAGNGGPSPDGPQQQLAAAAGVLHLHDQGGNGLENDLAVQPEAFFARIADVQFNHFVEGRAVLAADLPEAGEAGQA